MINNIIIIIGGGPAGLMAAGQAAITHPSDEIFLIEKMPKIGSKLALTGHGRCNMTNVIPIRDFESYVWTNFKWLKHAFFSFNNKDLIAFFLDLSMGTLVEENKVFPRSQKASDIIQTLIKWNQDCGVRILTETTVKELLIEQNQIAGVKLQNGSIMVAKDVILATGGMSFPKTGSTGDGYRLAKGHTIMPIQPILVALETQDSMQALQGVSLYGVSINAWINHRKIAQEYGDLLFTHFGISGPAVLSISRHLITAIQEKQMVEIVIDLFPDQSDSEFEQSLIQALQQNILITNALKKFCPARFFLFCLEKAKISNRKFANQISSEERKKIRLLLKNFKMIISTHRPISEAIITRGGIDTTEVDPKTMASKRIKGLYFAGEILDVDADTGGFNLQIAFSTGWLAGQLNDRKI